MAIWAVVKGLRDQETLNGFPLQYHESKEKSV